MKKLLLLLLGVILHFYTIGQTIYVDSTATGANDGTSWVNAYTNLQTAIDAAAVNAEIWVAAGKYIPTSDHTGNIAPANLRDKNFHINKDIKLYGGFDGTETLLSERDWNTNILLYVL